MTVQEEIDRIETMLDEIEENVHGAAIADTTARDLDLSALRLRRAIETWRAAAPTPEMVADISEAVADVLEESRAARPASVARVALRHRG